MFMLFKSARYITYSTFHTKRTDMQLYCTTIHIVLYAIAIAIAALPVVNIVQCAIYKMCYIK